MKYLVMECHPAYAVVLAEDGRFLRVANMRYQVGQQLDDVFGLEQPKAATVVIWKKAAEIAAAAACFCLVVLGMWQMVLVPCGTVRMQINPDVAITVNRLDYVTAVDGLNEDGKQVVQGYSTAFKKLDTVTDQLADRAVEMGYLQDGGRITLTVESDSEKWKTATEERLLLELEIHFDNRIVIEVTPSGKDSASDHSGQEIIIPVPLPDVSDSGAGQDVQGSDDADDVFEQDGDDGWEDDQKADDDRYEENDDSQDKVGKQDDDDGDDRLESDKDDNEEDDLDEDTDDDNEEDDLDEDTDDDKDDDDETGESEDD